MFHVERAGGQCFTNISCLFKCSLYDELRREWVLHIVNKTANFLELDKINKFKVIFDTHHRITAKFILRCYQLRRESLYRI